MITQAQVADLIEGDVVEIADERWPGAFVCGPLRVQDYCYSPGGLFCRDIPVRSADGKPYGAPSASLTVLERAPRPQQPDGTDQLENVLTELVHRLRFLLDGIPKQTAA